MSATLDLVRLICAAWEHADLAPTSGLIAEIEICGTSLTPCPHRGERSPFLVAQPGTPRLRRATDRAVPHAKHYPAAASSMQALSASRRPVAASDVRLPVGHCSCVCGAPLKGRHPLRSHLIGELPPRARTPRGRPWPVAAMMAPTFSGSPNAARRRAQIAQTGGLRRRDRHLPPTPGRSCMG